MVSGLFGDPLCVLFGYLHKNCAYDTLFAHTHTHTRTKAALKLCCEFKVEFIFERVESPKSLSENFSNYGNSCATMPENSFSEKSLPHVCVCVFSALFYPSLYLFIVTIHNSLFNAEKVSFPLYLSLCAFALFGITQMDINSWHEYGYFCRLLLLLLLLLNDDDVLIVANWFYFQLIMTILNEQQTRISRSWHRQKPPKHT